MFTFILTTEAGGEPIVVKADSRDVYVWERAGRDRTLQELTAQLRISECYALAHIACRRQQLPAGELKLEDFAQRYLLDFPDDDDDQEQEPDPSRPEPSPGD